jgi:hypothetical protein
MTLFDGATFFFAEKKGEPDVSSPAGTIDRLGCGEIAGQSRDSHGISIIRTRTSTGEQVFGPTNDASQEKNPALKASIGRQ